jgi:hypothetical protein
MRLVGGAHRSGRGLARIGLGLAAPGSPLQSGGAGRDRKAGERRKDGRDGS